MTRVRQKLRAAGRWVAVRAAPTVMDSTTRMRAVGPHVAALEERVGRQEVEIEALRARAADLEREVQECRRLNRRLAEVVDVVEEVLIPAADRDDGRLRRALDSYAAEL
jgi:uncharacterized coiled-coil protein SlyX